MKLTFMFSMILLLACAGSAFAQDHAHHAAAPSGKITDAERAQALKWLKGAYDETIALVEKLNDAQWTFKAAPEKWSVAECVEHIYKTEGLLFGAVERTLAAPVNPAWAEKTKGKTELLEKILAGRQGKAQAPEVIVPGGKIARAELMTKLKEARDKTIKFTQETQAELNSHTSDHPMPVFGTLNAYQWLVYLPFHNMRHNKQIAEVKADANFPK